MSSVFKYAAAGLLLLLFVSLLSLTAPDDRELVDEDVLPDSVPTPRPPPDDRLALLRTPLDASLNSRLWSAVPLLAQASEAAYSDTDAEAVFVEELGFDDVQVVRSGSMSAHVCSADDLVVIAFRGTDMRSLRDWLVNLDVDSIPLADRGMVQRGFLTAYQSMRSELVRIVRDSEPQHLWLTGHSLGGALATLCADDFEFNEALTISGLVTFGCPRVGSVDFARSLGQQLLYRHANVAVGRDIVTRVLPGNRHCGVVLWFNEGNVKRTANPFVSRSATGTADPELIGVEELPDALSEEELQDLQSELDAAQTVIVEGEPVVIARGVRLLDDHAMTGYRRRVEEHIGE